MQGLGMFFLFLKLRLSRCRLDVLIYAVFTDCWIGDYTGYSAG